METAFTPVASLGGGALIGLSAVLLLATTGKIAGISGIVSRLIPPAPDKTGMPGGVLFVVGLLVALPFVDLFGGPAFEQTVTGSHGLLALAGLLVGFGSVFGNGCTSGHGVCGISRLSGRSIAATCSFMATAFITVFLVRHVWGA